MARVLIREAHGGATRVVSDRALPYFQNSGWVVIDTLDDSTDASPLYLSKSESDFRYALKGQAGGTDDAGVAALVANAASQTGAALRTGLRPTFAPAALGALGNRWVALGDSVVLGADSITNNLPRRSNSWPAYVAWVTKEKLHLRRNSGVGGNTSAQMLARFDTDVTPYAPTLVSIGAGTNDMGQNIPFATFQANIAALVAKVRGLGAMPVLTSIPPRTDTATYAARISAWNTWLRLYALREGIPLVDFARVLTDPANGQALASLNSGDGIHPNAAGYAALGQTFADAIGPLVRYWTPPLPIADTDPNNLITSNALFLADNAGNGQSLGWSSLGASASKTPALITGDATIKGNWQQFEVTTGTGIGITRSVTTGFAVGDRLLFAGRFTTTGGKLTGRLLFTGTSDMLQPIEVDGAVPDAAFMVQGVVPAGTTALNPRFYANPGGIQRIAQVGIYNLTALGLTDV